MNWGWLPKHRQGSQIRGRGRARARAGARARGPLQHRQLFFQIFQEGLNGLFSGRRYDKRRRLGDHATNIAEDSFWRDQAADIRHTCGPRKEA